MIKIPRQQAQPGNSRRKQFILVGWTLDIHHDKSLNIQAVLVARTVSHKKSLICVISRSIRKTYIIGAYRFLLADHNNCHFFRHYYMQFLLSQVWLLAAIYDHVDEKSWDIKT